MSLPYLLLAAIYVPCLIVWLLLKWSAILVWNVALLILHYGELGIRKVRARKQRRALELASQPRYPNLPDARLIG